MLAGAPSLSVCIFALSSYEGGMHKNACPFSQAQLQRLEEDVREKEGFSDLSVQSEGLRSELA